METSTVESRLQTLEAQVRELLRLVKAPQTPAQKCRKILSFYDFERARDFRGNASR